jgi:hypothetical protein
MIPLNIPLKNEIKSRARVLTDEAFRETRNYIEVLNDGKDEKSRDFFAKNLVSTKTKNTEREEDETNRIVMEIRELLNKISEENFESLSEQLLKIDYDEDLLERFKVKH